ncbi:MAG: preprotein translocase subunit YajC [Magnetococcales bacterium]|nr:preprotein translocase subunit YajC [Magnetococcales bacterium]
MLDLLITPAYAEAAGGSGDAAMHNIVFMVLLFAIFYFLLIRPQQKQAKVHREMVANLQRGDSVVTSGGIMGKIHRVEEDVVVVEVGEVDGAGKDPRPVRLRVQRNTISGMLAKSGGSADAADAADADKG